MVKVEVNEALFLEVKGLHRRYKELDARHVVETALADYVELVTEQRQTVDWRCPR